VIDPAWEDPKGVPISAIIFGGRRSTKVPLVCEAFNWQHGVFFGAATSSETTAAAVGQVGKLRHDPFAMLPFCGYHMGDYFAHWLSMQKHVKHLPRIYYVNWFRKDSGGTYLWPGFGENVRVLKWIFERTSGAENGVSTPIGIVPAKAALDTSGLTLAPDALETLLNVEPNEWMNEVGDLREYFKLFGKKLPKGIHEELDALETRLKS
jgi:phosphoenolpyruvate carboxykinase (GTP)